MLSITIAKEIAVLQLLLMMMAMVKMTMLVKMMMMVPEEKEDNVEGSMEQGQ